MEFWYEHFLTETLTVVHKAFIQSSQKFQHKEETGVFSRFADFPVSRR